MIGTKDVSWTTNHANLSELCILTENSAVGVVKASTSPGP